MEFNQPPRKTLVARETVYLIFRNKWLIAGVVFFCLAISFLINLRSQPQYEATAKILVKLGREKSVNNFLSENETFFSVTLRPEDINTEIEIIKSPDLINELIQKQGFKQFLPIETKGDINQQNHQAMAVVLRDLKVEQIINSDVIELSYLHTDPTKAAQILNTLLELYVDKHIQIHSTQGIRDFLNQQAKVSEEHLEWYENKMEQFYAQKNEVAPAFTSAVSLRPRQIQTGESIGIMEKKMVELEFEKKRLQGKYEPGSLPLKDIDRQILDIQRMLQQERRKYAAIEREFSELERQKQIAEDRKILYAKKLDEARILEALDREKIISVKVISHAVPPINPKGLPGAYRYFLALVFSLLISLALVYFLYAVDDTFYDEGQLEKQFKITVAASIPWMQPLGVPQYETVVKKESVPASI